MTSNYKSEDQSPKRSERLRSKRSSEIHHDDQGSSTMSLDVLAHVASETLKKEPKSVEKSYKKVTLRNISNVDFLSLDQILGLTEKTIINLFTETSSNELSRTFTYTCQLMPNECSQSFTSFGSEMRARAGVKKHLYEHLDQLEKQELSGQIKFKAEPVPTRRKRLLSKFGLQRKPPSKKMKLSANQSKKDAEEKTKKKSKENYIGDHSDDKEGDAVVGFIPVLEKLQYNAVSKEILSQSSKTIEDEPEASDEESDKRNEENEQFIIELLSKTQPHHDHSYTTIFGKRKNSEFVWNKLKAMGEDQDVQTVDPNKPLPIKKGVTVFINDNRSGNKKPTPILFLRHRSPDENVPMVSKEEIIDNAAEVSDEEEQHGLIANLDNTISRGEKPYPPMPKSSLAKRGRLGFDITDISDGSEDEFKQMRRIKINPLGREGREGNLGWEPKLAMKFIKELKSRKKGDQIPLKCQICNDKTFTALATLLYHYRSHAGFKPFVCLICNTTFTRQHSLNYHMLIHNNQSRFTCKDCGRKFRHPSHFKEHLRRHTGETPFECKDCGMKFKTRNTYKRHLKTRHGKLLTATGIHLMPSEEFAKIRTKRYSIPLVPLPEISYKMPEFSFKRIKNQVVGFLDKKTDEEVEVKTENVANSAEDSVIYEELKQDIKTEVESENEGDPELATVLEALAQNVDSQKDTSQSSNEQTRPTPKILFVNEHMYNNKLSSALQKEQAAAV